jgi:hypothetical protein
LNIQWRIVVCIQRSDVLIILPLLNWSRPRLMFIFQTATPPCPPLIVKGGGHGGTRMFAPSVAMISSPGQ